VRRSVNLVNREALSFSFALGKSSPVTVMLVQSGLGKYMLVGRLCRLSTLGIQFSLFLYFAHETCDFPRTLDAEARVFFRVFPPPPSRKSEREGECSWVRSWVSFNCSCRNVSCRVDDIFPKKARFCLVTEIAGVLIKFASALGGS